MRLFAAQLLAGYLSAALLCRLQGGGASGSTPPLKAPGLLQPLDAIIAQAAVTYLKLCGFVLYFRLLAAGCGHFLPGGFAALPAMLLEVCSGCDYASRTGFWASSLCCAALSLQGASVLLQVRTICPPEISFRPLLAARLLHLPLSLALFYLGLPQQAVETFTTIHNYIDTDAMILRKGAVSAKAGEQLLIPINMRDGSLLCVGKGNEDWNCSAPHGAGRLMSRADAKQSFTVSEFKKQMAEVYTTSVSKATLDECPMAYKGMQDILDNIGPTAEVVKIIRPIYNFKAGDED